MFEDPCIDELADRFDGTSERDITVSSLLWEECDCDDRDKVMDSLVVFRFQVIVSSDEPNVSTMNM